MLNINMNYIMLLLVAVIVFYWIFNNKNGNKEGFYNVPDYSDNSYWDPDWVGKRSLDCYKHNKRECMKYSNCGLCIKDGKMQCIPGDVQGPLFKEDCEDWMYNNYYDRYIFGEKVVTVSPPWSKFYPDYEARYPSPHVRSTL